MELRRKILCVSALAFVASLGFGMFAFQASADTVEGDSATETASFAMVTGAQVRTDDPSGIRFVTDVNEAYKAEIAAELADKYSTESLTWVWGTSLTFKDSEKNEWTIDAKTEKWIENDTRWYTTLVGIPDTDYLTEITAESYLKIYSGDVLKETFTVGNPQTRSIARTASWALNDGYDQEILYTYTKAIANATVEIEEENSSVVAGTEIQLTATATEGYGIAWRSSNEDVATVDKNGKVTAVNAGTATITATLGDATDSYELEVKEYLESQLIKEFYKKADANGERYDHTFALVKNVVDANNFAYGKEGLGDGRYNSSAMYLTLSNEYMGKMFAQEDVSAITFDIILSTGTAQIQQGTKADSMTDCYTVSSKEYNGVTYHIYSVLILKDRYAALGGNDMALRYVFGGASTFFYMDNLTTVEVPERDLITEFYRDKNNYPVETLSINNAVLGQEYVHGTSAIAKNSPTMYMTLSSAYMSELFADESITAITFDVILSTATAKIQRGKNAEDLVVGATSSEGDYHIYSVKLTRAHYEKYGKTADLMLRYTGGGTSTFFYVDNLALVRE